MNSHSAAIMSRAKNDIIAHAASHSSVAVGRLHPKPSSDLVVHPPFFDSCSYKQQQQPPTTAPVGTTRNRSSEQSKGGSISDLLAHLDPLSSSNVSSGLRAKQSLR